MAEDDVICGYGEPCEIWLRDPVRNLLAHRREISRSCRDAQGGIRTIRNPHGHYGIRRQHHDAARTVARSGKRSPLRFLVATGGEMSPVVAGGRTCCFDVRLVLG